MTTNESTLYERIEHLKSKHFSHFHNFPTIDFDFQIYTHTPMTAHCFTFRSLGLEQPDEREVREAAEVVGELATDE